MQCGIYISMSICKTQAEPNHFLVASGSPYSTTLSYNNVISSVSPIFFPNRPTLLHNTLSYKNVISSVFTNFFPNLPTLLHNSLPKQCYFQCIPQLISQSDHPTQQQSLIPLLFPVRPPNPLLLSQSAHPTPQHSYNCYFQRVPLFFPNRPPPLRITFLILQSC